MPDTYLLQKFSFLYSADRFHGIAPNDICQMLSHLCLGFSLLLFPATIPCIFVRRTKYLLVIMNYLGSQTNDTFVISPMGIYFVVKWVNNRAANK